MNGRPQYGPEPLFAGADYIPQRDDRRLLGDIKQAGFIERGWWGKLDALLALLDADKEGR